MQFIIIIITSNYCVELKLVLTSVAFQTLDRRCRHRSLHHHPAHHCNHLNGKEE